jgi:hypothetical protein
LRDCNARLLDHLLFDINGISRRSVPVELGFGVRPTAIEIDRATANAIGAHTTYRADIRNKNGAAVGTHIFLDPRIRAIRFPDERSARGIPDIAYA